MDSEMRAELDKLLDELRLSAGFGADKATPRGVKIALELRDALGALKLDKLPAETVSQGVKESGETLMELANQLTTVTGVILSQAKDMEKSKATIRLVLELYEEMLTDIINKVQDILNDPKSIDNITLPSKLVFKVEQYIESGMSELEAAETAVNELVTDPSGRQKALFRFYKNKYTEKVLARTKELNALGVPVEAATLQAIDEYIGCPAVRDEMRERVHLVSLARNSGVPNELLQSILNRTPGI